MYARLAWMGWGAVFISPAAFLRGALIPFKGQEAVPVGKWGHPRDKALGSSNPTQAEAASPLLLHPCQPKAPGVAQAARATCVRQSLLPSTKPPAHIHTCLTTLCLAFAGSASCKGTLWAVVVSALAHAQVWSSPCPFLAPPELNVKRRTKQDYDNQVFSSLCRFLWLRDRIKTNGSSKAYSGAYKNPIHTFRSTSNIEFSLTQH